MKKDNPQLNALLRTITGKKVKALRRQGQTPATIYGHEMKPLSVQFSTLDLEKIFLNAGESSLVEVNLDDTKYPVLFKNPQFDPVTGDLIHLDCYKVNLKEKITATVPLELVGESPAVKNGNTLVSVTDEIEVEALPSDLPEKIEINIDYLLEVDQKITVGDIRLDSDKVEIKTDPEQVIVIIEAPRAEEIIETPEAELSPEDVPATAQKSPEEGESETPPAPPSEDVSDK